MAIFTAIATAIGGALGFGAASAFVAITAGILQTAAGIGLNLLAKAIAGEPEQPRFSVQGQLRSGGDLPRSFILGYAATAGSLVYANTWGKSGDTPNAYLTQVIAVSDLPIGGLIQFWVNGELVTIDYDDDSYEQGYPVKEYHNDGSGNNLWIKFYDGTQTTADPFLVDKFSGDSQRPWGPTRVGKGVAYVIVTAQIQEYLFSGFPQFKFALSGLKLYDPSRDSTVGGDGTHRRDDPSTWGGDGDHLPIVQLYSLLRGITYNGKWFYGLQKMVAARLPVAAWIEQINKCRALIDGPDGPEPTYRTGGEIQVSAKIADAIDAILTGCQGRLAEIGGVYKPHAGAPDAASAAINDGEILSTEEQKFTPFFGLADTINGITATYPNPDEGWVAKAAPPMYRADLEELAGGRRLLANPALDLVPYKGQVQRLMKSALEEAQRARRHTIVLPPKYWPIEPGDYIQWTSERNGYVNKMFRVDGVADKANLDVMVDITEVDPSDYDWDQGSDYKPPVDGPVGPIRPAPQQITGWQAQPYTILDADGKSRRPAIEVFFDGDKRDVEFVRIQVRLAVDDTVVFDGDHPYGDPDVATKSVIVSGNWTLPNTVYDVRGKYIPFSSRPTDWSGWLTVTTPNVLLGPDDVDLGDIEADIAEYTEWIGWNTRETIERARKNTLLDVDQDAGNYLDKQQVRREAATANAKFTETITLLSGETQALAQQLTELQVTVNEDIASAVNLLQVEINDLGDATAQSIQQLETEVDGLASSVTMRAQAQSSPGGGWARWGVEVKTGSGDQWSVGAFFVDTQPGMSRIAFMADQTIFTDGTNTVTPIVFSAGDARMNISNIGTVTAGLVRGASNNMRIELDNDRILVSD